jgi:hypothetical protein
VTEQQIQENPTISNPVRGRHYTTEKKEKGVYASKRGVKEVKKDKGTREPAACTKQKR